MLRPNPPASICTNSTFWSGFSENTSTENQAISRAYRMGQNRNVMVYRLLTKESIDETMMQIIHHKEDIFNTYANDSAVADAFMNNDSSKEENEAVMKKKVFQIERERLEKKKEAVRVNE